MSDTTTDTPEQRKEYTRLMLEEWAKTVLDLGAVPVALVAYEVGADDQVETLCFVNPRVKRAVPQFLREAGATVERNVKAEGEAEGREPPASLTADEQGTP